MAHIAQNIENNRITGTANSILELEFDRVESNEFPGICWLQVNSSFEVL